MAKILIVDDSRTVIASLARVLREHGHVCLAAEDGASGYTRAKQERPDLILMDVVMGEHNGFQTCRRIKRDSETSHIPVVLVTSKSGESDEYWGRRNGASAYLRKPVDPQTLLRTVDRLLGDPAGDPTPPESRPAPQRDSSPPPARRRRLLSRLTGR